MVNWLGSISQWKFPKSDRQSSVEESKEFQEALDTVSRKNKHVLTDVSSLTMSDEEFDKLMESYPEDCLKALDKNDVLTAEEKFFFQEAQKNFYIDLKEKIRPKYRNILYNIKHLRSNRIPALKAGLLYDVNTTAYMNVRYLKHLEKEIRHIATNEVEEKEIGIVKELEEAYKAITLYPTKLSEYVAPKKEGMRFRKALKAYMSRKWVYPELKIYSSEEEKKLQNLLIKNTCFFDSHRYILRLSPMDYIETLRDHRSEITKIELRYYIEQFSRAIDTIDRISDADREFYRAVAYLIK